jgi:ferredoxin-NADP reductase
MTQSDPSAIPHPHDIGQIADGTRFRTLKIVAIEREAELVSSYWLASPDGAALAEPIAGQFLPISVALPSAGVLHRTYTISGHEAGRYRLTIKREHSPGQPKGRVSNYIHDRWSIGERVNAGLPEGRFVLDKESVRPILMLAGGIGITPFLAMLRDLAAWEADRRVALIMSFRNHRDHPFRDEIDRIARHMSNLTVHVRYSQPLASAPVLQAAHSVGRIDQALLRSLLPATDADVYLCGPRLFMTALGHAVTSLGVPEARLRS